MAAENFPQFNFPHWRQLLKLYASNLSATKDSDTHAVTVTVTLLTDSPAARTACQTILDRVAVQQNLGSLTYLWAV